MAKPEYEVIISDSYFNRDEVANDTDKIYIFTENLDFTSGNNPIEPSGNPLIDKLYSGKCYPNSSQAIIRGLGNAYPIITKKGKEKGNYFDGDNIADRYAFVVALNKCISKILKDPRRTIVVSAGGFATERAGLPQNLARLLRQSLSEKLGIQTTMVKHKDGVHWGLIPYDPNSKNQL